MNTTKYIALAATMLAIGFITWLLQPARLRKIQARARWHFAKWRAASMVRSYRAGLPVGFDPVNFNSALFARTNGVFQYAGDGVTDFSAKTGLLAANSGTANLLVVNTSTTVPAVAVILNGQNSSLPTDMGVLGAIGPVRLWASGAINKYQRVQQDGAGGVVVDAGAGNQRVVVGVALEAATAGSYVIVATIAPAPLDTW